MHRAISILCVAAGLPISGIAATHTLNPTEDAYVRSGASADTNYGSNTSLQVREISGHARRSFLKFDISSVSGAVSSATLRVYANSSGGTQTTGAFAVSSSSWSETTITWNTMPTIGALLDTVQITGSSYDWYDLDVTSHVAAAISASASSVTICLQNTDDAAAVNNVKSREASSSQRPELVINTATTPMVANPVFSPSGGTFSSAQSVTISTSTSGANIRYTLDGSTPSSTTGTVYTGPIPVNATTTIKALAYKSGMTDSAVVSATYTITSGGSGPQLLNLPVPDDGTRYDSYAEFDGPAWPSIYGEGHVTLWHDDKFAAYSITIDDNNTPDFDWWLDVADTYGWKFTWFVIIHPYVWDIYNDVPGSNTGYFGTLEEWGDMHALGHDIQLHGACGQMNTLTEAQYEQHVILSRDLLSGATGAPVITFAYPCGTLSYGTEDYYSIIADTMIAARGTSGGVTPVHLVDYLNTKSLGVNALVDGEPGTLFERVYNGTRPFLYSQYRGWCVTLYHGMSDQASKDAAIETFDYVKANEDYFWVAPFTDVAMYAQERESSNLDITTVTSNRIEFTLTDDMDDTIFTHPLTVKIRLSSNWTSISATQNGSPIPASLVTYDSNTYALVYAVPDQGPVVIEP